MGLFSTWHVARRRCGFTLVELMVVVTIIGIMTAMMIPEMKGSFQDALLRSSSRELIGAFELAYSHAVSLNQTRRVLLDGSTGRFLVEKQVIENGEETFVPADDAPGEKGQIDPRIKLEFRETATPDSDDGSNAPSSSPGNSAAEPSDRTAIAFYPDGTADAAEVLLRDRHGFRLLLKINSVTGRVQAQPLAQEGAQ